MRHAHLLMLLTVLSAPAVAAQPRIHCGTLVQELGPVTRGARVQRTYELENRGDAPLHLRDVETSCACTTVPLAQRVIAPGETLPLAVDFDSTSFEGPVTKHILVLTDDPERPVLTLELRATVVSYYRASPSPVRLGAMGRNSGAQARILLSRTDGRPIVPRAVAVPKASGLEASLHPGPEPSACELRLRLPEGTSPRPLRGMLLVTLEDPVQPQLRLPLEGEVVPDLSVHPARLDFGRAKAGTDLAPRIRLLLHGAALRLGEVSVEPPGLRATVRPRRTLGAPPSEGLPPPPQGFEVQLQVLPGTAPGPWTGRLRIRSSSPDQGLVEIPLSGEVAPA